MNTSINGKCHCGVVEWEAELPPKIVLNCHCNMCRELSGADYSSWVVIESSKFKLTKGSEKISSYQVTEKFLKSFCSTCGSTVTCINDAKFPEHIYVAKGNISTEFDFPVNVQVYTNDKAGWIDIDEKIPVFNPKI